MGENKEFSAKDALAYLHHHGEVISLSKLRQLSSNRIISFSTTAGGHRRYTAEALNDYLSGFEHKVFYIAECMHMSSIVVDPPQLSIMKSERYFPISIKARSDVTIVVEIYNKLAYEKGSKSIFISGSKELMNSNNFDFLISLLKETKTTLILI